MALRTQALRTYRHQLLVLPPTLGASCVGMSAVTEWLESTLIFTLTMHHQGGTQVSTGGKVHWCLTVLDSAAGLPCAAARVFECPPGAVGYRESSVCVLCPLAPKGRHGPLGLP